MKKTLLAAAVAAAIASAPVLAQNAGDSDFYMGGGLSINHLSGLDSATGLQVFGGYKLNEAFGLDTGMVAVEVGYLDSGKFKRYGINFGSVSGLWTNLVGGIDVAQNFRILGRIGFDFGDDDGIMLGAGVGWSFSPVMELRGEYVVRDNVDSVQANLVFHF